ncbi:nucleoside deaminase [Petrachloros mirabilis]
MNDEQYMRLAIAVAREGIATGQTPFGACLVRADRVLACAHNAVWANLDITAHAEVQTIRAACTEVKTVDLSGCVLYSTCEPCPMCFSAAHWARVARIVYGVKIADAQRAGFHELTIASETLKQLGESSIELAEGLLREDCLALFDAWMKRPDRQAY